ncbi:MAG: hypothetical protein LWY06_18235 [Firmicutes bacterium]|nr:hypothetical protein [Bacillota bacterium]
MGFLSKLMGQDKKEAEALKAKFEKVLINMDYNHHEAAEKAREIINEAIKAQQESTKKLNPGIGDKIVKGSGFADAAQIREWLYKESVRNEDIVNWWSLPELEKWTIIKFDEFQIEYAREKLLQKGTQPERVDESLVKLFPIFDFIEEIADSTFPNRALPHELRMRVEVWMQKAKDQGKYEFHRMTRNFTSMNALIRSEITNGRI